MIYCHGILIVQEYVVYRIFEFMELRLFIKFYTAWEHVFFFLLYGFYAIQVKTRVGTQCGQIFIKWTKIGLLNGYFSFYGREETVRFFHLPVIIFGYKHSKRQSQIWCYPISFDPKAKDTDFYNIIRAILYNLK